MSFTHLTLSSEYSLVKGTVCINSLAEHCVARDISSVALTDCMNMFAAIKFYNATIKHDIKPLFGCEVGVSAGKKIHNLILIAKNIEGYKTIAKLLSSAYQNQERINSLPIIAKAHLSTIKNTFVLSGGIKGELGESLLYDSPVKTQKLLQFYLQTFGDNFIIDIHRIGIEWENVYLRRAIELANINSVPVVITNQVCFLNKEDHVAHEIRVAIHNGTFYNPQNKSSYTEEQYLKSSSEMKNLFQDMPTILDNTNYIASKCDLSFPKKSIVFPPFPIPDISEEAYLTKLSLEGLARKTSNIDPHIYSQQYLSRLYYEINILQKTGFISYFLIVADFVGWAKSQNIPVGPGRGSGAGSLVAYALNITDIDPIYHGLLFERFLNPERTTTPDFDIDFCIEGRDRVIDYVKHKYGVEKVAQIIAYSTLSARAVIRDVGRCLGKPYKFVSKIVDLVPKTLGITLEQATLPETPLSKFCQQSSEVAEIINMAKKLEGVKRGATRHAAGLVIAPTCLTDYVPLFCESGNSHIVTQFDKSDIEYMGLIKFDFLGLRTLTIINKTLHKIQEITKQSVCLNSISLNDKTTFDFLKTGFTAGIFQLESSGMQRLIRNINLSAFKDIVDLISLYRPGPLGLGMVEEYVKRKNKQTPIDYLHPALQDILEDTYGIIVYQEQIMQIAQKLSNFSLSKADLLQRAINKKQASEMSILKEDFVTGAMTNGIEPLTIQNIFDLIAEFAKYGFNKSHACSYSTITYQVGYLKAHYNTIFMSILLSADINNREKTLKYIQEAKRLNIKILPPDINKGSSEFTYVDERTIRFGLSAIKGIGIAQLEPLLKTRGDEPFKDIYDLCLRLHTQKLHLSFYEKLIYAGALDCFGMTRAELIAHLPVACQEAKEKKELDGQMTLLSLHASHYVRQIPEITYFHQKYWLEKELEALGICISGQLIHADNYWLQKLGVRSCKDITLSDSYIFAGEILSRFVMKQGVILVLSEGSLIFECSLNYEYFVTISKYCTLHKNVVITSKKAASYRRYNNKYYIEAEEIIAVEEAINNKFQTIYLKVLESNLETFWHTYTNNILQNIDSNKNKYSLVHISLDIIGDKICTKLQKTIQCSLYNTVNMLLPFSYKVVVDERNLAFDNEVKL